MNDGRLLDLITARATEGLSAEERLELDRLLQQPLANADLADDALELTAAAVTLGFDAAEPSHETMPAELKRRILAAADSQLPATSTDDTTLSAGSSSSRARGSDGEAIPFSRRPEEPSGPLQTRYLGWYAAAAMLILAIWAPWRGEAPAEPPRVATSAPTLVEQRQALLERAGDVIRVEWTPPEIAAYAEVRGDVVWSTALQQGYMRLLNLPANRATREQYQLWIVDPARDERPVDGGVFDIPAGVDEVIVPIDAKLAVDGPTVFAITLEQPGGVVVSDGPLLVVAPVQT